MMTNPRKLSLADKLHRGFVTGCIAFSATIALAILFKGYEYVLYVRPERKAFDAKYEQELLMEGAGFKTSPKEELKA